MPRCPLLLELCVLLSKLQICCFSLIHPARSLHSQSQTRTSTSGSALSRAPQARYASLPSLNSPNSHSSLPSLLTRSMPTLSSAFPSTFRPIIPTCHPRSSSTPPASTPTSTSILVPSASIFFRFVPRLLFTTDASCGVTQWLTFGMDM